MRGFRISSFLPLISLLCPGITPLVPQTSLPDGSGAFTTGIYRNLFAEGGHSEREIRAKIDAAYHQLFHGDPQTQAIAFAAGNNANGPLMYVTDWANHDVRTEGMSYGMMITVQLNKKSEFDAIWNWAKTFMYISDPKAPSYEFFAWSCKTDGTHNSEGAAPDGESYFAMALLFASNRWGDGKGIYDYHAEAEKLLRAMVHRPVISASGNHGMHTVGPMMNPDPPMILFVPEVMPQPFTDPRITWRSMRGALGTGGRPRFLDTRCRVEPGVLCEDDESADGAGAELCELRWVAARQPFPAVGRVWIRRVAYRQQLVSRLVVVAQGARRGATQRPHPALLRVARNR